MLPDKELESIFKQKKYKVEIKIDKHGNEQEVITQGFENKTIVEFKNWNATSNFERGCHYCGTTNEQSFQLYTETRNKINLRYDWTRGGKRGRWLEIDRRDPSLPYDVLENLVWCCYWCNNAKSNFFSEKEFKPIAEAIGQSIKKITK